MSFSHSAEFFFVVVSYSHSMFSGGLCVTSYHRLPAPLSQDGIILSRNWVVKNVLSIMATLEPAFSQTLKVKWPKNGTSLLFTKKMESS